jgi:hypothetical protein
MPFHPLAKAFLRLPFIESSKPLHTLSVREQFAEQGMVHMFHGPRALRDTAKRLASALDAP